MDKILNAIISTQFVFNLIFNTILSAVIAYLLNEHSFKKKLKQQTSNELFDKLNICLRGIASAEKAFLEEIEKLIILLSSLQNDVNYNESEQYFTVIELNVLKEKCQECKKQLESMTEEIKILRMSNSWIQEYYNIPIEKLANDVKNESREAKSRRFVRNLQLIEQLSPLDLEIMENLLSEIEKTLQIKDMHNTRLYYSDLIMLYKILLDSETDYLIVHRFKTNNPFDYLIQYFKPLYKVKGPSRLKRVMLSFFRMK